MTQSGCCRICGGPLVVEYPGVVQELSPDQLSPTSHPLGEHTTILKCTECSTLQQPALVEHEDLSGLYREMCDDAYLQEEEGRRRTARRLLARIRAHADGRRLLDVGCGHGLLLDEARKQGFETVGLELSAAGAAFGRDRLGLDIREQPVEELDEDTRFDVITLIDVLEHVPDPCTTIERCHELLAANGVLCVVTPDPASLTARVAGRRWWSLVPAHSYLIPRKTLLELLLARGLVIAADEPLVRSFSLGYWLSGLTERTAELPVFRSNAFARLCRRITLSLSLGDERVVLACKVPLLAPSRRLVKDRGKRCKVHVVLPAYNAASTIAFVAESLPTREADRALLVDDHSPDATTAVALREGFEVIRHPANRGYGANQKTCYVRAALDGADIVVMVHADHQYDPGLVGDMVKPIADGRADVVIGSRLLEDKAVAGGMPRWKWVGNRFLTAIENRAFGCSHSEYHTGYRAFSVAFLREIPFLRNSDAFVFDQEIFAQIVKWDARVQEIAIPTRYFLEASSVSFFKSVEYGLQTLWVLTRFYADRWIDGWPLLRRPAARLVDERSTDPGEYAPVLHRE
jgi:glycosyltransferase involved in cell wall biosynthesis/SAM-dependent methyltransferase